ncbi:MAG: DEAD/DEAH box helicase [Planctomycetota bacterium]
MSLSARRVTFLREQESRVLNLLGRTVARQPIDTTIEEAVEMVVSTEDLQEARVRAGGAFRVRIGAAGGDWSCSCPRFSRDMACEHILATLRCATADVEEEAPEPAAPAWLERLEEAAADAPPPTFDVWGEAPTEAQRLLYLMRVEGGALGARVDIAVVIQRRLASGEWGRPRPIRTREAALLGDAVLDEHDTLLLAVLPGLEPSFGVDWRTARTSDGAWKIDARSAELVLGRAVRTGRLHLSTATDMDPAPLEDALGSPWTLRATPGAARDGRVVFEHILARADRELGLHAIKLALSNGIVIVERELTTIAPRDAVGLLRDVLRRGPLEVPEEDVPRATVELARRVTAGGDDSAPVAAAPIPILRIERPELRRGTGSRLEATVLFDYGKRLVPSSSRDPFVVIEGVGLGRRNAAVERQHIDEFLAAGGARTSGDVEGEHDASFPRLAFEEAAEQLMGFGWAVEVEGRTLRTSSGTSIAVRSGIDWFDLQAGVRFGDQEVALPTLLQAIESGSRFVALGDGSRGLLPRDWVESWRGAALGRIEGDVVRFDRSTGWLLSALLEGREAEFDAPFMRLREEVSRMQAPRPLAEPEGFKGELREYQREGLGWLDLLDRLGLGGCLADEMGLGKTVQLLAHLKRRLGNGVPSLVVAPRSLVFNWISEARRFVPELRVADHTGAGRGPLPADGFDVIVTTYGTLRRDAPLLVDRQFDVVVLDEGQAIKNRMSQTSKAARLLRANQRIVLTGTPIENHLGELWSMMEFLNPGFSHASSAFRKLGRARTLKDLDEEQRVLLARALRPFFLRRTKADVARELPPRTEQTIECELRDAQATEYRELRDYYRSALAGQTKMGVQVIQGLLRLRQMACHPGLIDKARVGEKSAKLDTVLALLEDVVEGGNKALVFSQFTSFLAIVRAALDERGWRYAYLDGQTKDREREVKTFQEDPTTPLFLVSLKAGGSGLNLTAADFVILLDPWWNPAAEAQAIDRAHRIGRERPVHVYRLVARATIEERVLELQDSKRDLAAAVLGGATSALSELGPEDLQFLLS